MSFRSWYFSRGDCRSTPFIFYGWSIFLVIMIYCLNLVCHCFCHFLKIKYFHLWKIQPHHKTFIHFIGSLECSQSTYLSVADKYLYIYIQEEPILLEWEIAKNNFKIFEQSYTKSIIPNRNVNYLKRSIKQGIRWLRVKKSVRCQQRKPPKYFSFSKIDVIV